MNKERLLEVAALIEESYHEFNGFRVGFNMATLFDHEELPFARFNGFNYLQDRSDMSGYKCNSTACIAGFACLMHDLSFIKSGMQEVIKLKEAGKDVEYQGSELDKIGDKAKEILGLTDAQSFRLFYEQIDQHITGPEAAKVIRHFAETGDIDWRVRFDDEPEFE